MQKAVFAVHEDTRLAGDQPVAKSLAGGEQVDLQFGDWLVQPGLDLISRGPTQHKLERKAMQVLLLLVSRPAEVVSVQEILQHVWAGRVVEENSVHRRISQLRKALHDDAHNPEYIASVPRRGYRTLARVQKISVAMSTQHATAEAVEPLEAAGLAAHASAPSGRRLVDRLLQWHGRLLLGRSQWPYILLLLLALPLLGNDASRLYGPLVLAENIDFLLYGLFLPAWLFVCRHLLRLMFGATADSPLQAEQRFLPIYQRIQTCLTDWRPVAWAAVVSSLLMGLELLAGSAIAGLTVVPRFLLGYLITLTAVYILLFSVGYQRSIYIRSDPRRQQQTYVLDFDDGDRRFGLRQMATIFDAQIVVWGLGGMALLIYRYASVPVSLTENISEQLWCQTGFTACQLPMSSAPLSALIPDPHLAILLSAWFIMIPLSAWLTNLKLLPLRTTAETAGRVAYLREFIPATSKYDADLDTVDLTRSEALAEKFRAHDFAPIGDSRSMDTMRAYFFLLCLMCVPVLPSTLPQAALLCVFAALSFAAARLLFMAQQHMLARVDGSLA